MVEIIWGTLNQGEIFVEKYHHYFGYKYRQRNESESYHT